MSFRDFWYSHSPKQKIVGFCQTIIAGAVIYGLLVMLCALGA